MADSVLDLPPDALFPAVHRAQMRLQLSMAGRVHGLLLEVAAAGRAALAEAATTEGALDGLGLNLALNRLADAWRTAMTGYQGLFEAARREAVAIAFGVLPALHRRYLGQGLAEGVGGQRARARPNGYPASLQEAEMAVGGMTFYQPQLEAVLRAANERLYGDGFRLSQRIWRLDEEGLEGIRATVYAGVADSKSAWQIAEEVEQYLGAGQECPRWTRYRLYGLTKTQIAQGRRGGLYSGAACAEQGVAYKALRLARTELQYVHHLAGQEIRKQMPWVEKEQMVLSPAHPKRDICDEMIEAAPNGDGVYPKGEISLPAHPNCICDLRAVLMGEDDFAAKLRGWMTGSEPWAEMDAYATWLGMVPSSAAGAAGAFESPLLAGLEFALQLWLWGDEEDHDGRLEAA